MDQALYAKSNTYIDPPHCADCTHSRITFERQYMCYRFTSIVSGKPAAINCNDGRNEESLCGITGKYWKQKNDY
jgi:hypothetical protein